MRVIAHERYGAPDLLRLEDRDRPQPRADEVLVEVRAAALHAGDCFMVRGRPFPVRFSTGLQRPKLGIPGYDFAGTIVELGEKVGAASSLRVGAQVFGTREGTCREFLCAKVSDLAARPAKLSLSDSAALATSGLAALHALRDAAPVKSGQEVLIVGASGGVGSYAVQLAKHYGARVTGVCSTGNAELVKGLGAERVIDYTREDFAADASRYDLILDNVENRTLADCRRVLKPGGTLLLNSGTGATGMKFFVRLVKPLLLSPFVGHQLKRYLSVPTGKDLAELGRLVDAGVLKPVIDRVVPLEETAAALAYVEQGHARGKVIVQVKS